MSVSRERRSFNTQRDWLKLELASTRGRYIPGMGQTLTCPICLYSIPNAPDMHEWALTRHDARTLDNKDIIMTKFNCVLVHQECHPHGHGSSEEFYRCAIQVALFEGIWATESWLMSMVQHLPHTVPDTVRRFNMAMEEWNRRRLYEIFEAACNIFLSEDGVRFPNLQLEET